MSWGNVAVAGAVIVSGGMSYLGSKDASKASSDASAAQIAFEREKYDDWNEVYGPLQDNLTDYYSNVTPDYYASVGLEDFETQYQTSLDRIDENLIQRGIDPSSGIGASIEAQAELSAAETRASIRRDAPIKAAEDKSRFLQIGLGQNPGSSLSATMAQQTQQKADAATAANAATGTAMAAAIPAIGTAISAYNNRTVVKPPPTNYGPITQT